ncbi:MAG: sugar ABC transporter permease [Spirochaetales bacterium]|nr:sugar ABC transporter permease [Spirochaetales bacterium]
MQGHTPTPVFSVRDKRNLLFIILGLVPAAALAFWLHILPVFQGLYLSLFRWSGLSPKRKFVGLANFRALANDSLVWKALGHDVYMVVFRLTAVIVLALLFAGILHFSSRRKQKIVQGLFFFPNVLSVAVVGIIFTFIYNPSIGALNAILTNLGLENLTQAWLGNPKTAFPAVLFPTVWGAVGYQMLLLFAGMSSIPKAYTEVALLEGATRIQEFFQVTLPLLRNVVKTCVSLVVINTLNRTFIFIRVMTKGGPNDATEVLGNYMFYQGFENFKFGYATSIAVINFTLALVLTFVVTRLLKKENLEYA